jgi:hypothetical protein
MHERARAWFRAFAALLALTLPSVAGAQVLGTVAGNVKDASGAVLPGVTVEVSSPALIEKVRTAVTDGNGQYQIVNLPPGVYSVSFTLPGFSTVKREDLQVSVNFTSTVDAEMKVGSVEETITVTGESPIVDIQSAALTRSMTAETFKELPSGGSWIQMAALVPAIRASNTDVGGVLGDQVGAQVSAHGALPGDGVSMIDGLRIGNMYISSNLTNMSLSPLLFDQVDVQLSGQSGETGTNGVIMNAIPRAGGNRFSGSALANGSAPSLQGSNLTDNLKSRGATASTTLKTLYDLNGAVGGPIKQDKVWFYATSRYFTNEFYLASRYYATDASAAVRTDDLNKQAYGGTYTYDNNGRITWAINEKQKVSGWYAFQYKVDPHWLIAPPFLPSPEAARITTWHTQLSTTKWTYTATNKLLFEAGVAAGASPDTIKLDPDQVAACPAQGALAPRCISITVQNAGNQVYRAPTGFDFDDRLPSQSFNASASYVTGSHNAKFGFDMQRGHFWRGDNNDSTGGIWYTVNRNPDNSITPALLTIQSPVAGWQNNLNYNLGLFAQDRWTLDRLTVNGGVRVDFLNESTEPFTATSHRWLPNRNQSYAAVKNVPNWKDINPRGSVAYDVTGNGKTALKASISRGVEQDSIRYAAANNPASTLVTQTARAWTDNGDFVPQCDLTSGAANGECGPWITPNFGSANVATIYSPSIMDGWGVRPNNWEYSVGLQQEIVPRVSASVGYFSRVYGNFFVQDNESLAKGDFTQYSVTVPTDAKLPNSGQSVTGLVDPNVLVAARNVVKSADDFGKQQHHWNGVDLNVDARLRNGLLLQGGFSTGKQMTDNCDIIDDVPEALTQGNIGGVLPTQVQGAGANTISPAGFCHQESPFLTQYKALASYTLPWYGVRVSGTLQSLPGPQIVSTNIYNNTATNAAGFWQSRTTLGRPFTNAQANINVIEPGSAYGDRLNQVDLRFTKIVNVGKGRIDFNVDVYNAFNSDAVLAELGTIGAVWRRPSNIIQPRFVKFAARWDF